MIFHTTKPEAKRKELRTALRSGKLLQFPGAFNALSAMLIEQKKFAGVYISGSVLSNDLGYPDIGLTTLSEVTQRGRQIARATNLPSIIDADTGFGEPLNVTRSIQELIELGLSGCHIEDQLNPKRCGHLDGKTLVSTDDMLKKIRAAVAGKKSDPNFVLIARTDARASEGLDQAIDRAKAYIDAGADVIFPEALANEKEFETVRKALPAPLLANMTEFGKSQLFSKKTLENLGYNMVIYPVTLFRMAMKGAENVLDDIKENGDQNKSVPKMFTRAQLYELTRYPEYEALDKSFLDSKKS